MEPTVVNTVSYLSVSIETEILASPEVIKLSFLQAKSNSDATAHAITEKNNGEEKGDDRSRFIPPNLS